MEYIDVILIKFQKTIDNQYTKNRRIKEYDGNDITSLCWLVLHFHIVVKF